MTFLCYNDICIVVSGSDDMKYQINSKKFDEILITFNNIVNDELVPLISEMKKLSIHENWYGAGADRFDIYYNTIMQNINVIPIKLLICIKYLGQVLGDYSDTNQTLSAMFNEMQEEIEAMGKEMR